MPRSSTEILSSSRREIARGRPRAALRELEAARNELLVGSDAAGLAEALELARGVLTLAPVDTKARERLLAALERDIATLPPSTPAETGEQAPVQATASYSAPRYVPYAGASTEQILAPARAEIERGRIARALRELEKARRKLLTRSDLAGLGELIELARRLPLSKSRHEQSRLRLLDAAQQNVRYLDRRRAIDAGEKWSDPFAAGAVKTKLPSLPPMTRREIAVAAAIVCVIVGVVAAWAFADKAPQRVAHAIKCPTGEQGSPSWSPDGTRIAFAKNGDCGTQIMVVSLKDNRLSTVTSRYGVLPNWSPDGQMILYRSSKGFSLVAAGGGESVLLRPDDGDMGASWSPDGTRIAFVHGLEADPGDEGFSSTLYTMKPNGSGERRLLGHACNPRTPTWAPNGDYLVFACDDGIFDLPSKGGSLRALVEGNFGVSPISVSVAPQGTAIAFGWVGVELYSLTKAGDPKVLVKIQGWADATIDVAWSPDGRMLAFSITGSGADDGLYVVDRDGSHRRLLTRL